MKTYTSKVREVVRETPLTMTFILDRPKGLEFKAGQSALIGFSEGHGDLKGQWRPMTFCSSTTDDYIEFTIKTEGKFTKEIDENLKTGEEILIKGPVGTMFFTEDVKGDVVLICGGSGITPMMSITRYILIKGLKNKVTIFYSNKTQDNIIHRKELDEFEQKGVKVVHTLTREPEDSDWSGYRKRLDQDMLKENLKDLKNKTYFICGPPQMVNSVVDMLKRLGVPGKKIILEEW